MTGPFEVLVEMLRQNLEQARKLAAEHDPGPDGRCPVCRQGGTGAGRSMSCRLGAAAREALQPRTDSPPGPKPL